MARIAPDRLRTIRASKGLTLDALAENAKIDRKTIWRIEKNRQRTTRPRVLKQLAEALGIEPEVLVGNAPMPEGRKEVQFPTMKSQLNLRIATASRNFLTLVAKRYGVKPTQIMELAPFLFCCAAEISLQRRRERLSHFEQLLNQVEEAGEEFRHLKPSINFFPYTDEATIAERYSIERQDLFGGQIELYELGVPPTFDERENPFAVYLRALASSSGGVATFDEWDGSFSPQYRVCPQEAANVVDGDLDRAEEILNGQVALHEIPTELRAPEMSAERLAWVRERAAEFRQKTELDLAELLSPIDWKKEDALSELATLLNERGEGDSE
jgi:transcriptional regulator with XRE-family HTH domain